jgi:predicted secreted protein
MSIARNPTNLELLQLAKELAYSDYNNRRANIHNQWLADNETMLRTRRVSVPYPAIPPYPDEEEIIQRAKRLIDFLNQPRPDLEKQKLHEEVKELIQDVSQEIGKVIVVEEQPTPTQTTISEPVNQDELNPSPELTTETTEKTSVIEKIKNVWR